MASTGEFPAPTYAPADGRLAAAIAAISASRRPIRDGAERSNNLTFRIANSFRATRCALLKWTCENAMSRARRK
jgi:hypothetical protein